MMNLKKPLNIAAFDDLKANGTVLA